MADQDNISPPLPPEKGIDSGFSGRCCPGLPLPTRTAGLALSFKRMPRAGFDCGSPVDGAWMPWLLPRGRGWCIGDRHQIFIVLTVVFFCLIISLFWQRLQHFFWMNVLNNCFNNCVVIKFFWFCQQKCHEWMRISQMFKIKNFSIYKKINEQIF